MASGAAVKVLSHCVKSTKKDFPVRYAIVFRAIVSGTASICGEFYGQMRLRNRKGLERPFL